MGTPAPGGSKAPVPPAKPTPAKPIPPAPPAPPAAPLIPPGPIADFPGLARSLAAKIRDGQRDAVLGAVRGLANGDRDRLEAEVIPTLENDRLRPHGIALRRLIRYVRHPPPRPTPGKFTTTAGKPVKLDGSTLDDSRFVSATKGERSDLTGDREGYSLLYLGPDALDACWLQMIWREAVLVFPAAGRGKERRVAVRRREDHLATLDMPYFLSTHPDRLNDANVCHWHADAPTTTSPFYDGVIRRSGSVLYMFDAPSPTMSTAQARTIFGGADPPSSVESGFHATTYLVRGMDVLYRVHVTIVWTQQKGGDVSTPTITMRGERANELLAAHRARIALQAPAFDWLPGPLVSPPRPQEDFERVADLTNTGWAKGIVDAERLSDVALQANSGQVQFLRARYLAGDIHAGTPFQAGLNVGGLASAQGETGYVDASGNYSNPKLPPEREGRVPPTATIVGSTAFHEGSIDHTRDWPVATMRHEMRHVAQNEYAIGWLLRWRDDFTSEKFAPWVDAQFKGSKDVGRRFLDAPLGTSKEPIEVLAYTEGFLAGVHFLPSVVDPTQLEPKERWPTALRELHGAGTHLNAVVDPKAVQADAIARIRRFVCGTATPAEKDALSKWLKAAMSPSKVLPAPTSTAIKLVESMFRDQTGWLQAVSDAVTKPCTG